MSLLAEIRHRFGYRALARQGQRMPPARPLRSLAQVDSIGMLAPSDNEQDFSCILDYAFRLQQEQGKKTFVCTYNASKVAPAYLVARRDVTLLRPADLNWKMRPVSPSAETFCREPFDFLIDFTLQPSLPMAWIMRLSHASMLVGFHDSGSLDIQFAPPRQVGAQEQIEILERYLNAQS